MSRLLVIRNIINRLMIGLAAVFILLLIFFVTHIVRVNRYNNEDRRITDESTVTEVTVDIHKRALATDAWEKNDAFENVILKARIYEAVIVNNSKSVMPDWKLRINIKEDCYINNAWCGNVEIHQLNVKGEKEQTLDLRNTDASDVTLDHIVAGQDLLIPLKRGDYLIYHPNTTQAEAEIPVNSTDEFSGQVNIGFIFYGLTDEIDFSDYVFDYHIHKSYFSGTTGRIYMVLIPCWAALLILFGAVSWLILWFEGRLFRQDELVNESMALCANMADSKDYAYTGHSERVAKYSRMIAEQMGMDKKDCDNVYYAALLHNAGYNMLPPDLLRKTTKLSGDEFKLMQTHTVRGAELVKGMRAVPHAEDAARYHHERYDGKGYPEGKKGNDIPLVARIISVADAFDSMNHDRSYRKKYTREHIREELISNNGTQFDPLVVSIFLEVLEDIED